VADLAMLLFIVGFAVAGGKSGLIRRVVGLLFLAVSFVVGAYLRFPAGAVINTFLPQIPKVYAAMLGYTVASTAILLAFNLAARPLMKRVPQTGLARRTDQLLGVVFGVVEAVLILAGLIVILHTYGSTVQELGSSFIDKGLLHDIRVAVDDSTIGQLLEKTAVPFVLLILGPFLPKDITKVVPSNIPGGVPFFPTVPVP
jgi:uncharacterized membrane protein required for colicin V production